MVAARVLVAGLGSVALLTAMCAGAVFAQDQPKTDAPAAAAPADPELAKAEDFKPKR